MSDADVLHHSDRNHAVKLASQLAIVQFAELDTIGNPGSLGIGACRPDLLGRNVDCCNMGACFARKMNGKVTPAGTNLNDGHAWPQSELTGRVDQLVALCLFECVMLWITKIIPSLT